MAIETLQGLSPTLQFAIGTAPAAKAAGTVTGSAVDRLGFNACVLEVQAGAVTGTPTTFSVNVKLQHCDTSGGSYADFVPVPGSAPSGAVAAVTAINTRKKKSIDLRGAKRYLKAVEVDAFVGGTSPTVATAVVIVLGAADTLPAQADD